VAHIATRDDRLSRLGAPFLAFFARSGAFELALTTRKKLGTDGTFTNFHSSTYLILFHLSQPGDRRLFCHCFK